MRTRHRSVRPFSGAWAVGALLASVPGASPVAVAQVDSTAPAAPVAPTSPTPATDQFDARYPEAMKDIGIVSHLDEVIPLDLTFVNEAGKTVTLQELIDDKPTILTLNYFECPMLCTLTLNGMVDALNKVEWSAGEEFNIITLSFNPDEGPELAEVKKRAYLTQYRRDSVAGGWHFLTGEHGNIRALADAVGFKYKLNADNGEYLHSSSLIFLTPTGRISLYMNGVQFKPRDVRLALVDASEGQIGTFADDFLLFTCFRYDPDANSFIPSAFLIMRAGGLLTLTLMAIGGMLLWIRSPRRHAVDTFDLLPEGGTR
jgi:protein SCO1/2